MTPGPGRDQPAKVLGFNTLYPRGRQGSTLTRIGRMMVFLPCSQYFSQYYFTKTYRALDLTPVGGGALVSAASQALRSWGSSNYKENRIQQLLPHAIDTLKKNNEKLLLVMN